MKIQKDKFGDNLIKPSLFYNNEYEKIKLNWFLYELALSFEFEFKLRLRKQFCKYRINKESIANFLVYLAKNIKKIILQKLSGEIDKVYFSYELIESYFHTLYNDRLVDEILDTIAKAWDDQLKMCELCPTRCISEKDVYYILFDDGSYGKATK